MPRHPLHPHRLIAGACLFAITAVAAAAQVIDPQVARIEAALTANRGNATLQQCLKNEPAIERYTWATHDLANVRDPKQAPAFNCSGIGASWQEIAPSACCATFERDKSRNADAAWIALQECGLRNRIEQRRPAYLQAAERCLASAGAARPTELPADPDDRDTSVAPQPAQQPPSSGYATAPPPPRTASGPVVREREPNNDAATAMLVQPGTTVDAALIAGSIQGRATDVDFYRVPVASPGLFTITVTPAPVECGYAVGLPNLRSARGPSTMTIDLTGQQRTDYTLRFGGRPEERSSTAGPEPRELLVVVDTEAWNASSDRGVQCVQGGAWHKEIPYRLTITSGPTAAATPATTGHAAPPPVPPPIPRPIAPPSAPAGGVVLGREFGEPAGSSGRISNIVTARDVRSGVAVDVTDTFGQDGNPIHVWFRLSGFAPGTRLTSRWTYLGGSAPQVIGTGDFTIAPTNDDGTFSYELAAGKRWPAGNYRIEILLDGVVLGSATFMVRPESATRLPAQPPSNASTPEPPPYKTGTVSTGGPPVVLATQSVPVGGGTITVRRPGDPLDGLVVNVLPGAYATAQAFRVSSRPIASTTFQHVTPLTPLIEIENGGKFAENLMTVKVPVRVPAGQFAMAFFYDEQKRRLEGIPTVAMDDQSITIATGHFSDFFVSSVDESALTGDRINSRFQPQRDEWQFGNYNTPIVMGRCAGTSSSEIWYYYEKPDGPAEHLYRRYEGTDGQRTPDFGSDDVGAQRFVVSVQVDHEERGTQLSRAFRETVRISDAITVKLFAYSILVTGGPQLIEFPGHAMVATAVQGDTIFLIDPDFPGRLGQTSWADGELEYVGLGPIYFGAVYALVSKDRIAARWAEFKAGKAGKDLFPPYKTYIWSKDVTGKNIPLKALDGTRVELVDGLTVPIQVVSTYSEAPDWKAPWLRASGKFTFSETNATHVVGGQQGVRSRFGLDGSSLQPGGQLPEEPTVFVNAAILKAGPNIVGVETAGRAEGTKYDDSSHGWLGYDYVTINYRPPESLVLSPSSWTGASGQSQAFTVTSPTPLSGLRFEWLVDGQPVQDGYAPAYTFRSSRPGVYTLTVQAWDDTFLGGGKSIVSASLRVTVKDGTTPAQPSTPPPLGANSGNADHDDCLKAVKAARERYESALRMLANVRDPKQASVFSCSAAGERANWQETPPATCCTAFERDRARGVDAAWVAMQECGWRAEIENRRQALAQATDRCPAASGAAGR